MSQTTYPFWHYGKVGAFFGTPYRNFAGWVATGVVFMTVAAFFWKKAPLALSRKQLGFPLVVYLSNFIFSMVMTIAGVGIWLPIALGVVLGVVPALVLSWMASSEPTLTPPEQRENSELAELQTAQVPVTPMGVMPK
jgi:putative membrane protein